MTASLSGRMGMIHALDMNDDGSGRVRYLPGYTYAYIHTLDNDRVLYLVNAL